jgi:hypothetical protein
MILKKKINDAVRVAAIAHRTKPQDQVLAALDQKIDAIVAADNKKLDALIPHVFEMYEALQWYASPRTWNQWCPESFADKARAVLTKIHEGT